jgi:hypothetical protein
VRLGVLRMQVDVFPPDHRRHLDELVVERAEPGDRATSSYGPCTAAGLVK